MRALDLNNAQLRRMGKKAGCDALAEHFPMRSRRWYSRHWRELIDLTDPELSYRLTHADPVGERASNNATTAYRRWAGVVAA